MADLINQTGEWDSHLVSSFFCVEDKEIILSIPISPCILQDSWLWHYDKRARYSVKSGYKLLMHQKSSMLSTSYGYTGDQWKSIWDLSVPAKVKIFLWRAAHDHIPTVQNLYTRGVDVVPVCPLCLKKCESTTHALFLY